MQIKGTVSFQKHSRGSLFPKNISDLATPCNIQLLSVTKKEYFEIALFTFCSQLMDGICTCPHKYLSILIYLITFCICHPHIFRHNMAKKQDKSSLLRNPQHSTCKHTFWTFFPLTISPEAFLQHWFTHKKEIQTICKSKKCNIHHFYKDERDLEHFLKW